MCINFHSPVCLLIFVGWRVQFAFGLIPNIRAKGRASKRVADILNIMQTEEPVNTSDVCKSN